MIAWTLSQSRNTVCVDAAMRQDESGDWSGSLFGHGATTTHAANFTDLRDQLATEIQAALNEESTFPDNPPRIRIFSHAAVTHARHGVHAGGPVTVQAAADRMEQGWCAVSMSHHPALDDVKGKGATYQEASENLATQLMAALDIGVQGMSEEWSALELVVVTRKTYKAPLK